MLNFKARFGASAAVLMITGCSGGSSNSTSNTVGTAPPPTPPQNTAPIAAISFSQAVAAGNDTVTLDASQSSDADGDALTFSYVILDGPEVDLDNAMATNEFTVPSLPDSETLRVQLTVSDGQASDTAQAELAISAARLAGLTPIFQQSFGSNFLMAARAQLPPFNFPDGPSGSFPFTLGVFTSSTNTAAPPDVQFFLRDPDTDEVAILPQASIT